VLRTFRIREYAFSNIKMSNNSERDCTQYRKLFLTDDDDSDEDSDSDDDSDADDDDYDKI